MRDVTDSFSVSVCELVDVCVTVWWEGGSKWDGGGVSVCGDVSVCQ